MTGRSRMWLLVFALVGLVASTLATYIHYRILFDPRYVSFCDVNETFNCTQVYTSRFGMLMGVPVAAIGAIWFGLVAVVSAAGFSSSENVRDNVPGYLFALSTVGLAVILYLGYASVAVLKTYCILCLVTYAAVIGLFIVSGAATTFPMTTLPRRLARDLRALVTSPVPLVVSLVFLVGAVSTLAFFREARPTTAADATPIDQAARTELEQFMATAPRVPIIVPNDGAKVLIVKFNDFQCPACGQSYLQYKTIFAKYEAQAPGAVKVVLKDYPLNPNCNANSGMVHGAACDAAVAVRLAKPGKREALEDWLYTHQPEMTPASVRQAARDIGGVTDFDEKYATTLQLVKGDVALGHQLQVRQTPTFFMNGVKIEGMWTPQYFDQAIAYELKRAGSAKP